MSGTVVRNGSSSADPHVFEFGEQFAPRPQADEPVVLAATEPVSSLLAAIKEKPIGLQPMSTAQLLRDLKTRLRYVECEIKARKRLEKERDQIRRLIKAAKQDKATIHSLKRVAG